VHNLGNGDGKTADYADYPGNAMGTAEDAENAKDAEVRTFARITPAGDSRTNATIAPK
jgi:hypothetical protein